MLWSEQFGNPIQHSICQCCLGSTEESARNVQVLIDRNFCRRPSLHGQLCSACAQKRTQDRIYASQRPVFGQSLRQQSIDRVLLTYSRSDDAREQWDFGVRDTAFLEPASAGHLA